MAAPQPVYFVNKAKSQDAQNGYRLDRFFLRNPWQQVFSIFYKLYPNQQSKGKVLSEDTLFRELKDGVLRTKKLYKKTASVPKWLPTKIRDKLHIPSHSLTFEESTVDLENRTMTKYVWNVSEQDFLDCHEKCRFSVSQEPERGATQVDRQVWVSIHSRWLKFWKVKDFVFNYPMRRAKAHFLGYQSVLDQTYPPPPAAAPAPGSHGNSSSRGDQHSTAALSGSKVAALSGSKAAALSGSKAVLDVVEKAKPFIKGKV